MNTEIETDHEAPAIDDRAAGLWWWHLPDFIKPNYPFDVPPERMAYASAVFTAAHVYAACPEAGCRRERACLGGEGPPCYRADRRNLRQLLFLMWMTIWCEATPAECNGAFRRAGSPYRFPKAWAEEREEETPAAGETPSGARSRPRRSRGRRGIVACA
jgi:hypothetical protein